MAWVFSATPAEPWPPRSEEGAEHPPLSAGPTSGVDLSNSDFLTLRSQEGRGRRRGGGACWKPRGGAPALPLPLPCVSLPCLIPGGVPLTL